MSETAPRFRQPIDVEEFERRLSAPAQDRRESGDPLAELARLVGEGRGAFAPAANPPANARQNSPTPQTAGPNWAEPLAAPADHYDQSPGSEGAYAPEPEPLDMRGWERELRGIAGGDAPQPQAFDVARRFQASRAPAENPPEQSPPDVLADDAMGREHYEAVNDGYSDRADRRDFDGQPQDAHGESGHDDYDHQDSYPDDERDHARDVFDSQPQPSRLNFRLIGGVALAALVVVAGGAYALRGGSIVGKSTPTIFAAAGPAKIQPSEAENEAGAGQAGTVFDKSADQLAASRVVTNEEQPVDLKTPAKQPRVVGINGENAAVGPVGEAEQSASAAQDFFPAPKKVKTVSVRPDGTIIDAAATTPTLGRAIADPMQAIAPAYAPANPPLDAAAKATTRAAATPKPPAPEKPAQDAGGATSPRIVATAQPKPVVTPPAPKIDPKPVASTGAFAVQFAAAGSEAEAKDRVAKVQAQYASALGGHRPAIVKGEANGKIVFRVRAGGMSKDDAVAMCVRVKESGGACFVAGT